MSSSRLTGPRFHHPAEVVRWHAAMQAQDYGYAKWSIGQRSSGLTDPDVDRALAAGSIVRTHLLRPTWHFVSRDDVRWLLALTGPRVQRHNARRYRELGLDGRTLSRSEEVVASSLRGGRRLTRNALGETLRHRGIDPSGQRLPHILLHCELEAVICSGGVDGRQQTYALLDERIPAGRMRDTQEALVELVRRYLSSHGPATVQDLRWWASLTVAELKEALLLLGSEVTSREVGGLRFWSMASDGGPVPPARGAHLLQPYDELVVGYTESRYFGDPRAETARAAWADRTLPSGVVLLGGRVAGHWRRTAGRGSIGVDVLLYESARGHDTRALEAAAGHLGRFAGRPATVRFLRR